MKIALVCMLLLVSYSANAANILGLLLIPSPSHHIWNRSLMLALVARGHKVTVVTADVEKNPVPNYTQYVVSEAYNYEMDVVESFTRSTISFVDILFEWDKIVCKKILSSEVTREVLKLVNSTTFDLVIADLTGADCQLGFVHAFNNPPLIGITAYSHPLWVSYKTGNPHNPSYVPELGTPFSDRMDFRQRLYNTFLHLYEIFKAEYSYLPVINKMVQAYFGGGVPPVQDIRNNASLVMVNTHISFDYPRPLVPAIVEVGGLHIGPNKSLPQHLQKPMDEAKNGFIYFSLGSNLRSDELPAERRQVFLDAFSQLPYTVFWKWESDSLPGQPSNVIVGKWMPQRDILAHPNILLFITHNGLLSTQEAIYNGVPIIGMPFAADQLINAAKTKAQGFAETIDYHTVTTAELLGTIQEVATNPRYKENALRLSKVMKDQPETPLERAIFWTEYVIRHKGAPHLRSAAADLPLYKYLLLDVIFVVGVGVLGVLLLLYKIGYGIVAAVRHGGRSQKQKKH